MFTGVPNNQNEAQIPVRLDFQASQQHSFFARYMLTTDSRVIPLELAPADILTTGSQGPPAVVSGTDDVAHSVTFGHTYVINSAMVNSLRVVGNKITIGKPGPEFFGPQDVGINAYSYVPGYTTVRVLNGFNVGGGNFTTNVTGGTSSYGLNDDFTVVRGNHQIGFGGYYLRGSTSTVSNAWSIVSQRFHRPVHRCRDGRLLRRPRRRLPPGEPQSLERGAELRRRLRAGQLENQRRHAELRGEVEPVHCDVVPRR